ncbi:MAG: AAA family ATPase [Saprospiraceae bacterium]
MSQFKSDVEAVDALAKAYKDLSAEIGKIIVGQEDVVKAVIISLFSNGHSLLVGVPGLAKTLLVSTIAEVLDLEFKRIQFTPDLMPSDITGSEILDEDRPIYSRTGFANITG